MSNTPSNYALTVLGESKSSALADVSKLQAVAAEQLAAIPRIEREAALRAILCGLTLHRVKASLPHGQWEPWLAQVHTQNATSGGVLPSHAQVRYYMRLAIAAVEETKATKPQLLALPGDQTELAMESADSGARQLMSKLTKFVGARSLNELLSDLGIKDRKANRKHAAGDDKDEPPSAQTVQEAFNDIAENLRVARDSACDKAVWMSFTRAQHEDLRALFEGAADKVAETFIKTHGRKKS